MQRLIVLLFLLLPVIAWSAPSKDGGPLFDVHLHYSAAHAERFSPAQILEQFDRNGIVRAVVSSTPNAGTEALYRAAPSRIVPFLALYRDAGDKPLWPLDTTLPARVEAALDEGIWRGIGEFHIFAWHRYSPVFRRIVDIADEQQLILKVHGDPTIIEAIFEQAPGLEVIWAHGGTLPYPQLIGDYLSRYPTLYVDTSVRDERIAPGGTLAPEWRTLFLDHSDRILVGVDTFTVNRWEQFDHRVATIRGWLAQLPPPVAEALRHGNAARLFGPAEPQNP